MAATSIQYQATKQGGPFAQVSIPKPAPDAHEVAIRLKAIALAPLDWKQLDYGLMVESWPAIFGFDGAGIVEAVGEGVTRYKAGDEVFSFFGPTPKSCSYQEIAVVPEAYLARKPENLTFEQAASLPVGYCTAVSAISGSLNIPLPFVPGSPATGFQPRSILVLGGSSGVGAAAIQLLRIALPASTILTTSSSKHHEHIQSLGATKAFDQRSQSLVTDIKAASPDGKGVDAIIDAVGSGASQTSIFETFSLDGPKEYAEVSTGAEIKLPETVNRHVVLVFTVFGTTVGPSLMPALGELIAQEKYKIPIQVKVVGSGFDAIAKGLDELRAGVSGTRLVVTI